MDEDDTTTVLLLGNPNPQMQVQTDDGQVREDAKHLNQSITRYYIPADALDEGHVALALSTDNDRFLIAVASRLSDEDRGKYALVVRHVEQLLDVHSAGVAPTWVDCPDNPGLVKALAGYYNCAEGQPTNVVTNAGRDAFHEQHLKSTGQPAGFEYGALSPTANTPAAGDNSLAEEITTAEGGLLRKKMGFAHTAGTNTSTLTETWTANAHDSLPVTVKVWANFNKSGSGGTMGEEGKLATSATLSASGDSITVTWTLTAG
jgi:hypothetical protein